MKNRIAKKDLILLAIVAAAVLLIFVGNQLIHRQSGGFVRVTVDGEEYGTYPLSEDRTVSIMTDGSETNTLVISDGYADMTWADCPDKLCVHQKAIHANGETIVCLPNKVVVEVESDEDPELDDIVQ